MHFSTSLLSRTLQATLLFLVLSFQGLAQAPAFAWSKQAGGTADDVGRGIAVDRSGNSYVTGHFINSATFGSTTLTTSGDYDVFITKYDVFGNVLWAQKAGGIGEDIGYDIAVDSSGNSYVTGYFYGSATFGSTTLTSSSIGFRDIFIVKYDASGNVLWAKRAGGTGDDNGNGIAVDSSGNFYVTGSFYGTANFGSTSFTSSGYSDVFLAKYNASGNVLWAQKAGGTGFDIGNGIAIDGSGNSYITGFFKGSTTFGSTSLTTSGDDDIFIAKYDASGNVLWAQKAGGSGFDYGYGIAVDGSGNSYVTGYFLGTASFGSTTLSSSNNNVFIAKYDASGNVLWAKNAGGTSSNASFNIALDGSGNSYVTGIFFGSATFGSMTFTSSGLQDVFIVKYDALGNVLWAQKAGGTGIDFGYGIAIDGSGNSYITGFFEGSSTFGTTLTSNGGYDVFLCKLGNILSLPSKISAAIPTYPNPFSISFQLSLPGSGPATVVLTDMLGREVHLEAVAPPVAESNVIISPAAHLPSGVYGLQIRQGGSKKQGKVVKE